MYLVKNVTDKKINYKGSKGSYVLEAKGSIKLDDKPFNTEGLVIEEIKKEFPKIVEEKKVEEIKVIEKKLDVKKTNKKEDD